MTPFRTLLCLPFSTALWASSIGPLDEVPLAVAFVPKADPTIPEWVIAGIAAIETGSIYRDGTLVHYRNRRDGADGEVGPWQIAPAALSDLGVLHLRARIRCEPVLAESMARAWLLRCYQRAGDWQVAVAIYHTGPRGDRRRGRAYAERVLAAGSVQVAKR